MDVATLRSILLNSNYLLNCTNMYEAHGTSSSKSEYGNLDCKYLASKYFETNICVHFQMTQNTMLFYHFIIDKNYKFIHLHLKDMHYGEYFI